MKWAQSIIETCEAVGPKGGTEVGAKRVLNGIYFQTLLDFNEREHRIRYTFDEGSFPVSTCEVKNYVGQLKLTPVTIGNETIAEWSSIWEASFGACDDFCNLVYVLLLSSLSNSVKKQFRELDNVSSLHG